MDNSILKLKDILTSEQTAKLLVMLEKFNHKDFSVFNLWKIKKYDKDQTDTTLPISSPLLKKDQFQ